VQDTSTETKTWLSSLLRPACALLSRYHPVPFPANKSTTTYLQQPERASAAVIQLLVMLTLASGLWGISNNALAKEKPPGPQQDYQPPPNIPHTGSVIKTTRYPGHTLSRTSNSSNDDADANDNLSVAPWVESAQYDPDTGETAGQKLSNKEYDKILKDSPIDRGFGTAKVADIWDRVRNGFGLSGYEHPRVDRSLSWYLRNKKYLDRVTERAKPFFYYILQETEKRHIPSEIALLPIVESAFQPFAYSPGRAAGLWQFIPETAKHYGLKLSWWYDGRRDVYLSTQVALDYLLDLHDHFDGNWLNALAAYNSGQGTVDRAIRNNLKLGKSTDFWALDLPKETRGYVPKLLAVAALIGDPDAYHLTMKPIPNRPYFEHINVHGQIDLARAADMADMSIEQLYTLNPAFNRWATDPDGPNYLIIPLKNADRFLNKLASYKPQDRLHWRRHQIAAGESLSVIAAKYRTSVALLQEVNNLGGKKIRAGKSLIIPYASRRLDEYSLTASSQHNHSQRQQLTGQRIVHVVRQGDTFWELSKKYGVSVKNLANWNDMSPSDPLITGKTLVIWTQNNTEAAANSGVTPVSFTTIAPPSKSTLRSITYRVRNGDSLSEISQKFGVSVSQLRDWNALTKGNYIHPGQMLKVYIDVTHLSENI